MESNQHRIIKFQDVQQTIITELKERAQKIGISESVTLVDGFISQPFTMENIEIFYHIWADLQSQ